MPLISDCPWTLNCIIGSIYATDGVPLFSDCHKTLLSPDVIIWGQDTQLWERNLPGRVSEMDVREGLWSVKIFCNCYPCLYL